MHRTVLCGVLLLLSYATPADAAMYQVLAESDIDSFPGSQFFVSSFNSLADFQCGTPANTEFSAWSIGSVYSVRGVAYDGSQFHVLAESDIDSFPGSQFFISSFNSLADFLSGTPANTEFSAWSIGSAYSVGGLAYDGSQFHVLAESDIDSFPGSQFFVSSFNSLADFLSGTPANTEFSAWSIGSVYSVGGFEAVPDQTQAVPEPATGILLGTGLAGLFACLRRRRSARAGNSIAELRSAHH